MNELSREEWEALQSKYQNSTMLVSAILEGPAIAFIRDKKKRAGISGSRGKYISHCIAFYETHKMQVREMEIQIESLWKTIRRLQK